MGKIKVTKKLAFVAVVIDITLLLSLLLIPIIRQKDNRTGQTCALRGETGPNIDESSGYCFKLDAVACLERGYKVKKEANTSLCCGHLGDYLYGLMGQGLQEKMETDSSKGGRLETIKRYIAQLFNDSSSVHLRPAAHVGIMQNGSLTGPDSGAPRIYWEESGKTSFVSGGLIHGGDRVRVTKAGYYYVYTGLQYNVDPKAVDSGAIVAYIYRHVNGTRASRRKLMMARESSCKNTRGNHAGPVSVYMAGIFLLRDQDEISVRTHSQSLLNRAPATTYMGLHMV